MAILQPILQPVLQPVLRSVFDPPMRGGGQRWTPADLFANGEQGALYHLTDDFAGLYQDAAGTTPVTAVGQPVGLMLDRRFGLTRGAELVVDQEFNNASLWQASNGWEVSAGSATAVSASSGSQVQVLVANRPLAAPGDAFEVVVVVSALTQGGFAVNLSGATSPPLSMGVNRLVMTAKDSAGNVGIRAIGTSSGVVESLSVKRIPGNHLSQATTTARPTLRSAPLRIDYDGVDDYLRTVFPDLGSDVTIARSIPGVGAQILTGQTIAAGDWDDNVTSCATLVIDRPLTDSETALVTAFLNQQAGV